MKIDMSPQAVTNRMNMLNQLWELAVALRSSDVANARRVDDQENKDSKENDEPSTLV